MTIFLAEPDANPVREYANGVKVIRLHEFLGPARATLSTVADPWSTCGTVVREEIQYAYTGTTPNAEISTVLTGVSGQDSIRIPASALGMDPYHRYRGFIGVRTEGEIPIARQNFGDNFLTWGTSSAWLCSGRRPADLSFFSSSFGGVSHTPKELTNPYYKLMRCGLFQDTFFANVSTEWLAFRAGSGSGGTLVYYLDAYYLVPFTTTGSPSTNPYATADYRNLLPSQIEDPLRTVAFTYDQTRDNDAVDWLGPGQYSVMWGAPPGMAGASNACRADLQEGEQEKTLADIWAITGGNWTDDESPISDIALTAGSHYTPSHQIDADIFDRTIAVEHGTFGYNFGTSQENRLWQYLANHPFQAAGSTAGFLLDGTSLRFQDGKYDQSFVYHFPDPIYSGRADLVAISFGSTPTEDGTGATTTGHQWLNGMTHCVMEIAAAFDHLPIAGAQICVGIAAAQASSPFYGVVLDIPTSNAFGVFPTELRAGLGFIENPFSDSRLAVHYLGGLDSIEDPHTANTLIRCKVEMQWYYLRAKVWLDGDSEPDWMWDGHIPWDLVPVTYLYPWHAHSQIASSLRAPVSGFPYLGYRYFAPIEDTSGGFMGAGAPPLKEYGCYFQDFTLDWDAHGDDPTDISVRLRKYDDSVDYGTVVIPYEAQRLIIGPYDNYSFLSGLGGYSITAWKDEGAPNTQAAVLSESVEKIPRGNWMPQLIRYERR